MDAQRDKTHVVIHKVTEAHRREALTKNQELGPHKLNADSMQASAECEATSLKEKVAESERLIEAVKAEADMKHNEILKQLRREEGRQVFAAADRITDEFEQLAGSLRKTADCKRREYEASTIHSKAAI